MRRKLYTATWAWCHFNSNSSVCHPFFFLCSHYTSNDSIFFFFCYHLINKFYQHQTIKFTNAKLYTKNAIQINNNKKKQKRLTFRTLYHFLDNFGLPRRVLCQTTWKLPRLQKFWVIATVLSRLSTTCHQPDGTKTVSPGFCRISSWRRNKNNP